MSRNLWFMLKRPHKLVKAAGLDGFQPPSDAVREHPIMSGSTGTTGMITAENPIFSAKTQGGNAALSNELQNMGLRHEPTRGSYGTPENSFIVYGATRQQMFDLGHRYGQESVVHTEGGHPHHELMYTNGDSIGRAHKALQDFDYFPKEAPTDYFTALPSTGGYLRLKFDMDEMHDTPMRPLVTAMSSHVPETAAPPSTVQKHLLDVLSSLRKSVTAGIPHPHAYPWHDSHTNHHFVVKGTGGVLVHTAPHLQKADGAATPPTFAQVQPQLFESVLSKHPNLGSMAPNRDYSQKRTFLSPDKSAGYALHNDGEICHLFSFVKGNGAHALRDAISRGGHHLAADEGGLTRYYSHHGFVATGREPGWNPRAPDVISMHLQKADGEHPHMDGPKAMPAPSTPSAEPEHATNDQAAGVGVSTYAQYAAPYGSIDKANKSDLLHYPLHGKLPEIQQLVKDHGYSVYYAGGKFGRPDLAKRNYGTKHLMIYDPTPESGANFGERDYTDAWRQSHELAHALVHPELNSVYGEGRRIGKLGVHRTLNEATRAVHWEWMAAHKQRELLSKAGVNIPDDIFHRELNTVMHDAVHRAVTGKFTEPSAEGYRPHDHKVPLETSLGLVRAAAHNLGLSGSHDLLTKSEHNLPPVKKFERSADVSQKQKTYSIPEVKVRLAKAIKERVSAFEGEMLQLRTRELRKNDSCVVCNVAASDCACFARLEKAYSSKDNMNAGNFPADAKHPPKTVTYQHLGAQDDRRDGFGHGNEQPHHIPGKLDDARHAAVKRKKLGKDELCADCGCKECECKGVLPDDKKSDDVSPDESGSGGETSKGKKLGKGAAPMAAPSSAKAGSPKLPAGPKPPMAKAAPSTGATSISPAVHTTSITPSMASQPGPSPTGSDTITGGPATGSAPAPSIGGRGGHTSTDSAPSSGRGGRGGKVMGKSESSIPGRSLAKALPRLGGKDSASQAMTQHAAASAPVAGASAPAASAAPKLGAADQAARHAQYADFTPAGAFPAPAGAAAGAMKPGPVTPPAPAAGTGGLKPPSAAVSAAPAPGGRLQRFTDALHGKKKAQAPLALSEMRKSLGSCLLCASPEHAGECK